ncbi:MAG: rod shape-determining protein MreD [Rickettsiales bacterium]|nr:rod shape-determining protein MreD [Rickettsiales bacterium]
MAKDNSLLAKWIMLHVILIFFVIFNVFDVGVIGFSNILPFLEVAAIFYFAVYKRYIAIWFVFVMGLWADSLSGSLLGVSSLCYILLISLFLFLNHKMYIRDSFSQIWQQFAVFCFLFLLCKYLGLAAINGVFYDGWDLFIRFLITSLFYPSLHKFFDYLSRKLVEDF